MGLKGSSSSGPDWTDISLLMNSLERFHGVTVNLLMSHDGGRDAASIRIVARARKDEEESGGARRSVSRACWWPNADGLGLVGTAFRLLYELDVDCGAFWTQSEADLKA